MDATNFRSRSALAVRAHRRSKQFGATTVEYAVLLCGILLACAFAIKTLGKESGCATQYTAGGITGGGLGGATTGGQCGSGSSGGSYGGGFGTGGLASNGSSGSSSGSGFGSSGSSGSGSGFGSSGSSSSASSLGSSGSSSSGSSASGSSGSIFGSSVSTQSSSHDVSVLGYSSDGSSGTSFASQVAGKDPHQIDLTLAKLAQDVYDENAHHTVDGFVPIPQSELDKYGITADKLKDDATGFKAAVYRNAQGQVALVYAGTDPGSYQDWKTDLQQARGKATAQYAQALALGRQVNAVYGKNGNLVVTGHSLGSGLGGATAAAIGVPAVLFNGAGVHDNTLAREGVDPVKARQAAANGQIRSYYIEDEILNAYQHSHPNRPQVLGTQIKLPDVHPTSATAYGIAYGIAGANGVSALSLVHMGDQHRQSNVVDSLSSYLANKKDPQ